MKIRNARLSDCKACHELSATKELLNPDGSPPPIEWFKGQIKNKQILLVAEEKKEIIGYLLGDYLPGTATMINLISVKKEFQRKGVGQKLLKEAEKLSKKKKKKLIILYGYAKNKKTLNFFEKNNYQKGGLYYEFMKFI
ncbi:MAG: GNAT family N-acetyltransferase [Candidatus Iainarchaeum sp.]|jgi:ribosomal protein S18 acetylase RimI-like enzyme